MKRICQCCGEYEIYGNGELTKGLCLNCYNIIQEESRQCMIEVEADYYEGRLQ